MPIPSVIPTPDVFQARKILAVQPHYDDNDIGAGGTLAKLHEMGAVIIYLTVTDDLMGVLDPAIPPDKASAQLKREQEQAGNIIGVSQQYWLGYPDAGKYDYFAVRQKIITHIRMLRPDFIFTPDPWLHYEAHRDHVQTGLAAADAASLYGLLRIPGDPQVDAAYQPYDLLGIAFYYTAEPNKAVDISSTRLKKEQAIQSYASQFTPEDMQGLLRVLDIKERSYAEGRGYTHAEGLKVMNTSQLHCGL